MVARREAGCRLLRKVRPAHLGPPSAGRSALDREEIQVMRRHLACVGP